MKNVILLSLLLSHIVFYAQRKPKIKGNRFVTEVSEALPPFNAIELNDDLDITLKKSFGEGYEITADDNLIDILKFKVEDSTLVISSFYTVTSKKQFDITVNFTELKAITLRDGSLRNEDNIDNEQLYVNAFGNSKLNLRASASVMDINLEENSRADFNLDVDSLNVFIKDKAQAYAYSVTGTHLVNLSDNASAELEGTSDDLRVNASNNAKLKGEKLEAASLKAIVEGYVMARLYAYRDFELSSKGNSKTYLYGDPKITISEFLDTSQLIKKQLD